MSPARRKKRASTAAVDGLNPDDPGMGLLAQAVAGVPSREILLVCCGDVPGVGPQACRVVLDLREHEGAATQTMPVQADLDAAGLAPFGHALVWPRAHLGKDFSAWCLARGALALRPGGTLWCAVRKAKGARSLADELAALMGEVDVVARDRGHRLLRARRTAAFDPARARAWLDAAYVIEDPALPGLSLRSGPGVFSRRELDAGTRQLIEHATARIGATGGAATAGAAAGPAAAGPAAAGSATAGTAAPRAVVDLGCGVGPLALWAATHWPTARVLAVDTNLRAVALARANAARHGLHERVRVLASDGLPRGAEAEGPEIWEGMRGAVELALVNPPTHADPATLLRLAEDLRQWLAPGGVAMLVVSRAGRMAEQLQRAGASVQAFEYPRYHVLEARWRAGT